MNIKQVVTGISRYVMAATSVVVISGCAVHSGVKNPEAGVTRDFYVPAKRDQSKIDPQAEAVNEMMARNQSLARNDECLNGVSGFDSTQRNFWVNQPLPSQLRSAGSERFEVSAKRRLLPLSPGDRIEVLIHEGEEFSGQYVVNHDGTLELPYLPPITVVGLDTEEVENRLELQLVRENFFLAHNLRISVRPLQWAPVMVSVSGAVFNPGRVLINERNPQQIEEAKTRIAGDYPTKRYLSEALRAAAGVRPDARIDKVVLIRDGWHQEIDLSGIFTGNSTQDVPLIAGDKVVVPTAGCFQRQLARPSQITPKGIRVFISNLASGKDNAAAAVGNYATSMPYGTRLLQAVVSGNCAGGTQLTNASRFAVLVSENPITGQSEVVERSIEELMRNPERDNFNPYLQPNDSVACYDSSVTNIRDIARTIIDIVSPIKLLR
ncbi:polysaccharide biosynthesis/export family protein [Litorivivens sp.]|uniref:polysaccharide biosynthesis/export family protein n=3 Tax=Litorivivens sp. TaxID=2020868 RepID=UPI0035647D2D